MHPHMPPSITERFRVQSLGDRAMVCRVVGNHATDTTERTTMITRINIPKDISRDALRRLGLNALLAARLRRRAAKATEAEQLDAVVTDAWNAFYNRQLTQEESDWVERIADARRKELGWTR